MSTYYHGEAWVTKRCFDFPHANIGIGLWTKNCNQMSIDGINRFSVAEMNILHSATIHRDGLRL